MYVNNQRWLFTYMDLQYKWFVKKQAGGRKLPLSDNCPRMFFHGILSSHGANRRTEFLDITTSTFSRRYFLRDFPGDTFSEFLGFYHSQANTFYYTHDRIMVSYRVLRGVDLTTSCSLTNHLYRRSMYVNNQRKWFVTNRR